MATQHPAIIPSSKQRRSPTGIHGFDDITGGGLPTGRLTLVVGGIGCGKTLFALQSLVNGARSGEPGIFVAFEERAKTIIENAASFGWDLPALERAKLFFLNAQLPIEEVIAGGFTIQALLAALAVKAKSMRAKRIVFDGIDVLLDHLTDPTERRRELLRLNEWLRDAGMTAIMTAKANEAGHPRDGEYGFIQFMVDVVVRFDSKLVDRIGVRSLRVQKYRGGEASVNEFPMVIGRSGLEVARHRPPELEYTVSQKRISSGIERLDRMLSGGFFRGTTVLVSGQPGTAKSTLAGSFSQAACKRRERTLYISFDEAADQIVRNFTSVGILLSPHMKSGLLRLQGLRSEATSSEAHLLHVQMLMHEHQPTCLVLDPLSAVNKVAGPSKAADMVVRLLAFAKSLGITTFCTTLLEGNLGTMESTPTQVASIADTWIHLANVVVGGERNRTLTVVKSRGTQHSNQVREMKLGPGGVTLEDVYASGGEVLMGTARWEKERSMILQRDVARAEIDSELIALATVEADARSRNIAISRELKMNAAELHLLERRRAAQEERWNIDLQETRRRRQSVDERKHLGPNGRTRAGIPNKKGA